MYILSGKKSGIWCLLTGLMLITSSYLSAQSNPIKVAITVLPPYTSAIADYVYTPNKVVASLTNTGRSDIDLYLQGSITSDGGIVIKTSNSYKPANPVHLSQGMMYSLTPDNIQGMFDMNTLDVVGIDLKDLLNGAGLPEDNYQICIRAYDYYTNQPVSEDEPLGCSNYFMVTNLEPPIITMPFCGDSISIQPFQNILVSWTIPAGAIGAQYKFEMIEIPEGVHITPNNAFQSSGFPVVLEETTPASVFSVTPDKAILTPGYTYAFRVQVFDPLSNLSFRNDGYSEVCYFTCKAGNKLNSDGDMLGSNTIIGELADQFEYVPTTIISGKLYAKFPDSPHDQNNVLPGNFGQHESRVIDPSSLNHETINLDDYQKDRAVPDSYLNRESNDNTAPTSGYGHSYEKISEVSSHISSDISKINNSYGGMALLDENNIHTGFTVNKREPYYNYGNQEEIVNVKPLANSEIRLVARFAVGGPGPNQMMPNQMMPNQTTPEYRDPQTSELVQGLTDLDGNAQTGMGVINVVLATATTDENGNYSFNFNTYFYTGYAMITSLGAGHYEQDQYKTNPLDKLGWGMEEVFPGEDFNVIDNILNENSQNSLGNNFTVDLGTSVEIANQYSNIAGEAANGIAAPQTQGGMQAYSYVPGDVNHAPAYICLKIEVANEKFCSPDIDIFAMPGDMLEVPAQVAKLKTYNLEVKAISSDDDCQLIGKSSPMNKINVHVYRKMEDTKYENPLIIDYEGQRLETQTIKGNIALKDVAIDTTEEAGTVYIKNLVKHAHFNPQYFVNIAARNFETADDEYEETAYNYESIDTIIPTNNQTDATYINPLFGNSSSRVVYNRFYEIPEVSMVAVMKPKNPEIKGRIMTNTNYQNVQLSNTRIQLLNDNEGEETYTNCLDNGIFRFKELPVRCENGLPNGPFRRILISHTAYQTVLRPQGGPAWNLSMGSLKNINDINMEPSYMQSGYVIDEDGNPVSSHVKSEFSPYYITTDSVVSGTFREFFSVPIKAYGESKIKVIPKSSQYFECDTFTTNSNYYFAVKVYKRLHRPKITVVDKNGTPIAGAKVKVGEEEEKTTNNDGIVSFKFASPGEQYIIKIIPPPEYVPVQEAIIIPISRYDTLITYKLEYGKNIHGTVTEKISNSPIASAIVYAELKNTDGTILYIESTSDNEGKYSLRGIPYDRPEIEIFAVKKGNNPSYIGDSKTIYLDPNAVTSFLETTDFKLTLMENWDLSSIWGYPVTINSLRKNASNPDEYFISGYFYNPPASIGISLQQPDVKLSFSNLKIKKGENGKIEPIESTINLNVNKIPLFINQTFSGTLYNYQYAQYGPYQSILHYNAAHFISKNNNKATLNGMFNIDLETFRFAYSFYGELYLGNDELGNRIEAFSKDLSTISALNASLNTEQTNIHDNAVSAVQAQQVQAAENNYHENLVQTNPINGTVLNEDNLNFDNITNPNSQKFNIFSLNAQSQPIPIQDYSLFKFPATSLLKGAHVNGNRILIPTILHTDIELCDNCQNLDLNLYAGNIIITKNNVNLVALPNDTLQFQLENWKVINKGDWEFDKNEEAIIFREAHVITGKGLELKINDLKIWYSNMGEGQIDISNGALTLGGFANITINNDLKPSFNYDATGHYRISFVGSTNSNKAAATVQKLPAMENNERIKFESIGLLSNGLDVLTINQKIRFFNIIDVHVDQIVSGDGYFDLLGMPELGIPDLTTTEAFVRYSNKTGNITAKVLPLNGKVDPPGYITFNFDTIGQKIENELFETYGTLTVSPGTDEYDSRAFSFEAKLTRTNSKCEIILGKRVNNGDPTQDFVVGDNTIKVFEGSLHTKNNYEDWSLFTYKGNMDAVDGMEDNNTLDFTVDGDIEVTSSNLKVSKINTGLGSMELIYDFDNNRLHGNLQFSYLPLGYATLKDGSLSIMFDNQGYYLSGRSVINMGSLVPFNCGFIIGNSSYVKPSDANEITANFNSLYKPNLNTIHGFYIIGELIIVDEHAGTPIDLLSVDVKAGIGVYFEAKFDTENTLRLGGYIYGDAWGGFSVGFCDVGAGVYAKGGINGEYNFTTKTVTLDACISSGIKVGACGITGSCGFFVKVISATNGGAIDLGMNYGFGECP